MKEIINKYKARLAIFAGIPFVSSAEYITLPNAQEVLEKAMIEVHNNALKMVEEGLPEEVEEKEFSSVEKGAIGLMQMSYKMTCKALKEQRLNFINNINKLKL